MGSESAAFLFSTPEMTVTFSLTRQLRAMMQFEWALTCALERQGIAEAVLSGAIGRDGERTEESNEGDGEGR